MDPDGGRAFLRAIALRAPWRAGLFVVAMVLGLEMAMRPVGWLSARGLLWLPIWLLAYRTPRTHPKLGAAELAHIESDPADPDPGSFTGAHPDAVARCRPRPARPGRRRRSPVRIELPA